MTHSQITKLDAQRELVRVGLRLKLKLAHESGLKGDWQPNILVSRQDLTFVLNYLPKCEHPKTQLEQSASGNESWLKCIDCGMAV